MRLPGTELVGALILDSSRTILSGVDETASFASGWGSIVLVPRLQAGVSPPNASASVGSEEQGTKDGEKLRSALRIDRKRGMLQP